VFQQATLEQIQAHYPDFRNPVYLHELQVHIVGKVVDPIFDRNVRPGNVVVDLGCGSGTTVKKLAERGAIALGIDVSSGGFVKYRDLTVVHGPLTEVPNEPGGYLIEGDITRLPLPDETADLVTSRWVFEHLEDPGTVIAEIRRILKPGGLAVIIVPNLRHPGIFLSSLLPLRIKQALLRSSSGIAEDLVMPTYYRANTPGALARLFGNGFEAIDLVHVQDPSYWLFSKLFFRSAVRIGRITRRLPLESFRMHTVASFRRTEASAH
jgi:SAM-dependent methyltransferase